MARKRPSLLSAYAPLFAIASLTAIVIVLRNTGNETFFDEEETTS